MSYKNEVGKRGEELAADFLENNGYRISGKNVRISHDEIDIVAEDDKYIVFVEVKTRAQTESVKRFGRPAAAVDFGKRQRLIRAAEEYIRRCGVSKQPRIDVIEVYFPAVNENTPVDVGGLEPLGIKHLRNAVHK